MIEEDSVIYKQAIDKIIKKLGDLPTAPVILDKAIKLTSDLQTDINILSRTISLDQSLTAKIIRISNSPIYRQTRRLTSLEEAIKVLGFIQVKSMIITATTLQFFKSGSQINIAMALWHHSLSTAIACRLIAKKIEIIDKEEAYLGGLLHDIGKMVLLKTVPQLYVNIIKEIKDSKEANKSFEEIEMRELEFNHILVSNMLLTQWGFPKHFVSEITEHNKCRLDKKSPSIRLSQVLAFADGISSYIGTSFYESYKNNIENDVYLGSRLITEEEIVELRSDTESIFFSELNNIYE